MSARSTDQAFVWSCRYTGEEAINAGSWKSHESRLTDSTRHASVRLRTTMFNQTSLYHLVPELGDLQFAVL